MTTELSTITNPGPLLPANDLIVSLQEWASELQAAKSLGMALSGTTFVPQSLKVGSGNRPLDQEQVAENVAACILAGKSLNIDPMTAIQNIFVVHGKPGMYARTMVALVLRAKHAVYQVESTEQRVVWEGHRAGEPSKKVRSEWTIQRATTAGYLSNAKYKTNPIEMLTAKCQAEVCRLVAPDVLTGIASSSVEEVELEDLGETPAPQGAETPAPSTGKRTVQRGRQQAPAPATPKGKAPEPEAEPEPASDPAEPEPAVVDAEPVDEQADTETGEIPEPEAEPLPIGDEPADQGEAEPLPKMASRLQRGKLTNALKPTCADANEALARISDWLGRPISSTAEMTETECLTMIAEIEAASTGTDQ